MPVEDGLNLIDIAANVNQIVSLKAMAMIAGKRILWASLATLVVLPLSNCGDNKATNQKPPASSVQRATAEPPSDENSTQSVEVDAVAMKFAGGVYIPRTEFDRHRAHTMAMQENGERQIAYDVAS